MAMSKIVLHITVSITDIINLGGINHFELCESIREWGSYLVQEENFKKVRSLSMLFGMHVYNILPINLHRKNYSICNLLVSVTMKTDV